MTADSIRLLTLLDRSEIEDVAISYATALDTRDWDRLHGCFAPDCVVQYAASGEFHGPQAVVDACRSALAALQASQHFLTNFEVVVDGDSARSVCYFAAQHVRPDALFVIGGTYSDHWSRSDRGWRIARRRLTHTWESGDPAVLFGGDR